ncbi:MAG: helix-turn-helix transcriptional regulator [Vicinamibacterales bacterium]
MDESIGARLRAQRERRQVTLAAIADQTKIRLPLLEALERSDLSAWPEGIFRRSYLRTYAAAIGLDPEETLREFLALHPDPVEPGADALARIEADTAKRRPRTRLRYLLESLWTSEQKSAPQSPAPSPGQLPLPEVAIPASLDVAALDEEMAPGAPASPPASPPAFDLSAIAHLCSRLAQADRAADVEQLMSEAARSLNAIGMLLWIWDAEYGGVRASLGHGYSRQVLARLPLVRREADNAIGAALRTSVTQVVDGHGSATSAIVIPLLSSVGCTGVLAVECASGLEHQQDLQAVAGIIAAQLSALVDPATPLTHTAIA